MSSQHPKKKLVIEMSQPELPPDFDEDTLSRLESAFRAILKKEPTLYSLEKLYKDAENICREDTGSKTLYIAIGRVCEEHISAAMESLAGQSSDTVEFLYLVEKCWQDFCDQMLLIRNIVLYLDRTYAEKITVRSLRDRGSDIFKRYFKFSDIIVKGLLSLIDKERLGEEVDKSLLSHLLKMFTALSIYSEFEKEFLDCSSEFYASEGVNFMQLLDVPDYLKHVEKRLKEELDRCLSYLDASTEKPLVSIVEEKLLVCNIPRILDKGFPLLIDGKCIEDLRRMYTLFSRVDSLESIRTALENYIKKKDEEKDKDMVFCLLQLKASLDTICEESFCKNEDFRNTIKDSFEHLINIVEGNTRGAS